MNRRKFALSASAALALVGNRAMAQRGTTASSVLVSELTGGEVDTSGSDLEMVNHHMEAADGSEHFHFLAADESQFDILIWPHASGDVKDHAETQADMFFSLISEAEVLGSDEYDDGGWLAFSVGTVGYIEYQRDAYPDHDIMVQIFAAPEAFEDVFAQAQAVLIDGLPPFLFAEESDIVAVAATVVPATTPSSGRTSRGSSSGSTGTETGNSRSSRSSSSSSSTSGRNQSSRTSSGTGTGGDPVDAVRTHRNAFLDSYDEFFAILQAADAATATEAEAAEAFSEMVVIAEEWEQAPEQAAAVAFGPEHAELQDVYLDWADIVGELGTTFIDLANGLASVDDFLGVYELYVDIDAQLMAVLNTFGRGFQRRSMRPRVVARRIASVKKIA